VCGVRCADKRMGSLPVWTQGRQRSERGWDEGREGAAEVSHRSGREDARTCRCCTCVRLCSETRPLMRRNLHSGFDPGLGRGGNWNKKEGEDGGGGAGGCELASACSDRSRRVPDNPTCCSIARGLATVPCCSAAAVPGRQVGTPPTPPQPATATSHRHPATWEQRNSGQVLPMAWLDAIPLSNRSCQAPPRPGGRRWMPACSSALPETPGRGHPGRTISSRAPPPPHLPTASSNPS